MAQSRKTQYYPFKGGLNTEDPALSLPNGELIDVMNYEPVTRGGYRRIDGYERFDGRLLASQAVYHTVDFDAGEHEPQIGETLQGATSTALGVVLAVVVDSGDWSTNDAAGYLTLWVMSGSFVDNEVLVVSQPEAFTNGFSAGFA